MARINLHQLSKTYPGAVQPALSDLSLTIQKGEVVSLLGPSGCGKTTALRLIAGFERPDSGRVTFDGKTMVDKRVWVPAEKRNVGMVFQDYALFPHLNVERNIGFGLRRRADRGTRVRDIMELAGLTGLGRQFPHQLSGGQQQRVALARALVRKPLVVLLDEPFCNLDADSRWRLRREILGIIRQAQATAIFVTHDQTEALVISDRIAVLNRGRIEQVDTPEHIYRYPESEFTATFVGQSNLLQGIVGPGGTSVATDIGPVPCHHTHGHTPGDRVVCSVRPNGLRIYPGGTFSARLVETVFSGTVIEATAEIELTDGKRQNLLLHLHPEDGLQRGNQIHFDILPQFVAVVEPNPETG